MCVQTQLTVHWRWGHMVCKCVGGGDALGETCWQASTLGVDTHGVGMHWGWGRLACECVCWRADAGWTQTKNVSNNPYIPCEIVLTWMPCRHIMCECGSGHGEPFWPHSNTGFNTTYFHSERLVDRFRTRFASTRA